MTPPLRDRSSAKKSVDPSVLTTLSDPVGFSPLVAEQWASLIIQHWQSCQISGEIDRNAPLDILDFMPGCGNAILLLISVLSVRLADHKNGGLRFRYLPVAAKRECFEKLRRRPEFSDWFADETLVPLLWGRQGNRACLLLPNGRQSWDPKNPVVMLMHDFWAHLPQRLLAIHYGKLFEADLATLAQEKAEESEPDLWKKLDSKTWNPEMSALIDQYLVQLNSAPLPYPEMALNMLDSLTSLTGRPFILFATAKGYASEQSLRMGRFPEMVACFKQTKGKSLPINFDFLAHKIRQLDGEVGQIDLQKGAVLQIAMHGHVHPVARLSGLLNSIDTAMFMKGPALVEAMSALGHGAGLDSRLALIKLSGYDTDVFCAGYVDLITSFAKIEDFDRAGWRAALDGIWANFFPKSDAQSVYRKIATAAMHCGYWSLARIVLNAGLENAGKNATDLAHRAWCEARTGRLLQARKLAEMALALDPGLTLALEVSSRIETRLASWSQPWRMAVQHDTLPLSIEPLDVSHAEALLYQYRDPQIAVMVGLPALTTLEKVREWIAEQNLEKGRVNFAVMHADHGFVGYINLAVSAHASYFCFWTGVDFQGKGFATAAGRLVCQFAKNKGIRVMLTAAYIDNARSIRALKRLGFVEIPVRALPPDHDRIFFYLPGQSTHPIDNIVSELYDYYKRENLPLYFPGHQALPVPALDEALQPGVDLPV